MVYNDKNIKVGKYMYPVKLAIIFFILICKLYKFGSRHIHSLYKRLVNINFASILPVYPYLHFGTTTS